MEIPMHRERRTTPIKKLTALAAVVFVSTGVARAQATASNVNMTKLNEVLACSDKLTDTLNASIGNPPRTDNLKRDVHWIRMHLPPEFQKAFGDAGADVSSISEPEGLSELAKSGKLLYRLVLVTAFRNLLETDTWRNTPCADGVPFQIDEYLNSLAFQKLEGTDALAELKKLSGNVPRLEGGILVVMLTLDATEQPWQVSWLSQAATAQKEWSSRLKKP